LTPAAAVRPVIAIVVTALAFGGSSAASAPLPSGAIAVPTDENLLSSQQAGILCNLAGAIPPVAGVLQGDPTDLAWPVWLQAPDGHRTYVLWPRGFSVRFDPAATLLDENGSTFLSEGSPVALGQVAADPAYGTKDRPFVAGGLVETGLGREEHCYVEKG
jgi:hypothetical protein